MGRILQGFFIVAVAVFSSLVLSWREMTTRTARSVDVLQQTNTTSLSILSAELQQDLFSQLPPVVQTYLSKALPSLDKENVSSYSKQIASLQLQQRGNFSIQPNHWVPFTATQHVSAVSHNVGFVWDAIVFVKEPLPTFFKSSGDTIHLELPCFVQDEYVKGKGLLEARLLGVLRVAHLENSPDINAGELLRWLAESFLVPTVLLPNNSHLTWTAIASDPNKARLSIKDPLAPANSNPVSLTVTFDDKTGLPVSVVGLRAKAVASDEFGIGGVSYTQWQGNFRDYIEVEDMMVPSKFEAGWYEKEKLNLYFQGENYDFDFTF